MLSKYGPSLVSNPRDEISRFVTRVADLVREECRTTMLHDDMTLSILIVYAKSIEESKLVRIVRNFKNSKYSDESQPRSKKMFSIQDKPRSLR